MEIDVVKTIAYFLISSGVFFNLVSAVALIRYPDFRSRVTFSTKLVTLGTGAVMAGVFLLYGFSALGVKALICVLLITVTSPVEANALLLAEEKRNTGEKEERSDENAQTQGN